MHNIILLMVVLGLVSCGIFSLKYKDRDKSLEVHHAKNPSYEKAIQTPAASDENPKASQPDDSEIPKGSTL